MGSLNGPEDLSGRVIGREYELTAVRAWVEAAAAGTPGVVLLQGPAGIGRTAVLRAALRQAHLPARATVLRATCSRDRERTPYGLVRALLAPLGDAVPAALTDAAAPTDAADHPPADYPPAAHHALVHACCRAVLAVADRGPLVLVVDDLQWADEQSLTWLGYLLRRTADVPVCVVLSVRTPISRPAVSDLVALPPGRRGTVLVLAPLDESDVAQVAVDVLPRVPTGEVVRECLRLSAGNPLLLHRVLAELRRSAADGDPAPPAAACGDVVVAEARARLAARPESVTRVARAVAVLGRADTDAVVPLAGMPAHVVDVALRALRDDALLAADGGEFGHPVVRQAVLDSVPAAEAARLRLRAARLLSDASRPAEEIAAQVLHLPDVPAPWMAAVLWAAADDAVRRGDPEAAARYSATALRAGPDEPELHVRLADHLANTDPAAALTQLRTALSLPSSAETGLRTAVRFAATALAARVPAEAIEVLEATLDRFPDGPDATDKARELRRSALAVFAIIAMDDQRAVHRVRPRLAEVPEPGDDTAAARQLLAASALSGTLLGEDAPGQARRAGRALLADPAVLCPRAARACAVVLDAAGDPPAALAALTLLADHEDATPARVLALGSRAVVHANAGAFAQAGADARLAVELGGALGHTDLASAALSAVVLLHEGDPRRAEAALADLPGPNLDDSLLGRHHHRLARAQVLARFGDVDGALRQLERCGRSLADAGVVNPLVVPWWAEAALLAGDHGRPAEAAAHAERGEHLCRNWDVPRARGLALLARAAASPRAAAVEVLVEAVRVLEESPARYDLQRAQQRLGEALLGLGDPTAARPHLRRAVELATLCGSRPAALRSRTLLVAAGGRMRTVSGTRDDVLTGSERRVAVLAAEGATNRQIASTLFITPHTVETHLARAYRKLAVPGRSELAAALTPVAEAVGAGPRGAGR